MSGLRRAWPLIIVAALLATLAACGKKSGLDPPDDATVSYTYPQQYPNPGSVIPDAEKPSKRRARLPPPHVGGLSPFPTDGRTTTTYQSGPPQ